MNPVASPEVAELLESRKGLEDMLLAAMLGKIHPVVALFNMTPALITAGTMVQEATLNPNQQNIVAAREALRYAGQIFDAALDGRTIIALTHAQTMYNKYFSEHPNNLGKYKFW